MTAPLQTEWWGAIPPAPRHAITFHMPLWSNMLRFRDKDPEILMKFTSMYPRMMPHKDVKELMAKILSVAKTDGQACIPFTTAVSASECVKFATSPSRKAEALSPDQLSIRIFDVANLVRLYVVFLPAQENMVAWPFWMNAGVGISSRWAEDCVKHGEGLREATESEPAPVVVECEAQGVLRERIAGLMERAPAGPPRKAKVTPDDVYLYQTGMASIYSVHQYLLSVYNAKSVLFGFAFHSTPHVLEDFGPGFKFLGNGTPEEIDELEQYLKEEAKEGRKIQAVWLEFPSNPNLSTPDIGRLRKLADGYGFLLLIDDTLGSFCNVDVLEVADIVLTSLTKSFSGYADVMAASAVLNPSSARYPELKALFKKFYTNQFYNGDAEALEKNSRDYMSRSATLNNNALRLVEFLQTLAEDPKSSVAKVFYPTTLPSLPCYKERMRSATEDFTPGYGCLFSVELDTLEATAAFYDNLNLHKGPHLGAPLTLIIPYVMALYGKELDKMADYGMNEKQIRVAVGLENTDTLIEEFRIAIKAADGAKKNTFVSLT
ncbi:PLP-dependent transferase [Hyaloscypha bicolor E]|uniref:PLP-dependent transferase n=1 Tax=Hyaloscypha bicolor E TaxID=1095630 RepID=A0A2J6T3I4_9HELO|nr:PLP-dependent transferase [Hyaloscypha bicolor E]PMD57594.1 PLP-dependent transferase [Hyaloscypha bicolor E]